MFRHGPESYGLNDSGNNVGDRNDQDDNPLNRSFGSAASNTPGGNGSASSSKAVLAALRALQDKIRRLESERAQALDETVQLRHQLKTQEIESDHVKQRDHLAAQKTLHEIRSAYERLLTEKTEVEIRLSKLEDRNRDEQQISEELRNKIVHIEGEKHDSLIGIKDLEGERLHLQGQIQHIQQKEKDLGQTIVWETKRHEEDMDILSSKLRALQSELSAVTHEKSILETKLIELDQLVGQLLSVNESLVVRLSGKPLPKGSQLKTTTVKKKKVVAQPQSRSTIPLRLSASAQGALNDVKNLHGMHKMYVDLAHSITDPHATISLKKVRRSSSSGEVTGKQLKSSTLIKSKKIQGERSYEESNSNGNMNVRIPYVSRQNNDESIYDGQNLNTSQSGGFRSTQNGDLQVVINSLEEEFEVLNDQYHNLLTSVQSQSSSEATHAEGLVAVIQKLHKKGEQLRALKSPPRRDR